MAPQVEVKTDCSIPGCEYIIAGEDGVFIFWPEAAGGAYNPGTLRAIAREIDRLNEAVFARWERHYAAQVDRNPKGHDPAEGHGRNDESPVAATSGDAPEGS